CDVQEYAKRTPRVTWTDPGEDEPRKVTDYYRLAYRAMIGSASERTLSCALIPNTVSHVNNARTYIFKNKHDLLNIAACHFSLPFDFLLKSTGKQNLHNTLDEFSFTEFNTLTIIRLSVRVLILSCITDGYVYLWNKTFTPDFSTQRWSRNLPQLPQDFFANLTPEWQRHCA
ncbi:hypothetical protein JGC17_23730, partial [Salmonella enterica subsp. enterica serovar Kentucky]|nr:hypothetical protein [Salmonella enterica subsp. enterica serovar Kentucky]